MSEPIHCITCGAIVCVDGDAREGTMCYVNADGSEHVCTHHIGDANKMVDLWRPLINAAQAWYAGGTDDQGLREAVARFRASTATDAPVVTGHATTDSEMPEWVAEEVHAARARAAIAWLGSRYVACRMGEDDEYEYDVFDTEAEAEAWAHSQTPTED